MIKKQSILLLLLYFYTPQLIAGQIKGSAFSFGLGINKPSGKIFSDSNGNSDIGTCVGFGYVHKLEKKINWNIELAIFSVSLNKNNHSIDQSFNSYGILGFEGTKKYDIIYYQFGFGYNYRKSVNRFLIVPGISIHLNFKDVNSSTWIQDNLIQDYKISNTPPSINLSISLGVYYIFDNFIACLEPSIEYMNSAFTEQSALTGSFSTKTHYLINKLTLKILFRNIK